MAKIVINKEMGTRYIHDYGNGGRVETLYAASLDGQECSVVKCIACTFDNADSDTVVSLGERFWHMLEPVETWEQADKADWEDVPYTMEPEE